MAKVLVVDDSELVLRIFKDAIEAEGHEVVEARDGEAALKKFLEEKPDLVITDCLIPKIDGFKLVKKIRELEEGAKRTPVVMTSAIYRRSDYHRVAIEAGADLYIAKPTTEDERREFKRKVNELAGIRAADIRSSDVPID